RATQRGRPGGQREDDDKVPSCSHHESQSRGVCGEFQVKYSYVAAERPYFGKITGSTLSVVYMQRSLCPHSGTICIGCLAPSCSLMYSTSASPLARRVAPCAMAEHDESNPPSGSTSTCPNR